MQYRLSQNAKSSEPFFRAKLIIFFIKPSLFPEFPLQTHGKPSVQIHKPETEIRFDPHFPASTSSSSSCYLPPKYVHWLHSNSTTSWSQTTIISCSDNHNHLLSALTTAILVPLWSFMHITARGIFLIQIWSCHTSAKNFSMVSHYFRVKTNSLLSMIYIFLPCLILQLPSILSVAATLIIFLSSSSPFLLTIFFLLLHMFWIFFPLFSQLIPSHPSNINPRTISIRKPFLTYLSLKYKQKFL